LPQCKRLTDGQTEGRTDTFLIASPRWNSMQRKNYSTCWKRRSLETHCWQCGPANAHCLCSYRRRGGGAI